MECRADMPDNATVDMFKTFKHMFFLYYIFTTFTILRSIQVQIQDSNSIHNASIVLTTS